MPSAPRPLPVTGWLCSVARALVTSIMNSLGRATFTPPVPRTTTALRFLLPMTAPMPPRPAARFLSFMMPAYSIPRSPGVPMVATRTLPCFSTSASVV